VLRKVLAGTVSTHTADFDAEVAASPASTCFSQLLVGDGGYIAASRGSLAGTGTTFGKEPSFFSSANWFRFRQHTLQVRNCMSAHVVVYASLLVTVTMLAYTLQQRFLLRVSCVAVVKMLSHRLLQNQIITC
jgi:hypothetical protein